jgi:ketosteroid isomerase-like protein
VSRDNLEWVRKGHEAWARGDLRTVERLMRGRLSEDFEIHPIYLGQVYKGLRGMRRMWADAAAVWEDYQSETDEIVDLGDHVLVVGRVTGRGAGSGVPISQPVAMLWSFEGDKATRAESFTSRQAALDAIGARGVQPR